MGYNQENYRRIRQEYETKYIKARDDAEVRRAQIHVEIPEIQALDRELNGIGLEIMRTALDGGDTEAQIQKLREKNETLLRKRRVMLAAHGYPADYTEVRYECPLCGDTGFVDCKMCVCMKKKLTEAGMESSGMSKLLKAQNFNNFSLDYYRDDPQSLVRMTGVVQIMKKYAEDFCGKNSGNMVLFGGTGLGKTHLSSAVAARIIERGYDVYYTSAVGVIGDFENQRFGNFSGAGNGIDTRRYYDCDLLIIDDLGTEVGNQFTTSVLYDLINTRLNRSQSTVISTNLSPDEFRRRYWDRITSRVLGEYTVLQFVGRDIRAQKLQRK